MVPTITAAELTAIDRVMRDVEAELFHILDISSIPAVGTILGRIPLSLVVAHSSHEEED